jgi:mono/diheme cytochrome c family protein
MAEGDTRPKTSEPDLAYGDWGDPFAELPTGEAQRQRVCGSGAQDLVHEVFCADEPAHIESLTDLERALHLDPETLGGLSGSALSGHSTSLSLRSVSAINPRAILFRQVVALLYDATWPQEMTALAFTRGEQFSEVVVIGKDGEFNFYLVRFDQECNDNPQGCSAGDLLTDAIERDWRNVTLYDEASLANTQLDCAPCHQPNGPNSSNILRMQEFASPWSHWLFGSTDGGRALLEDYRAAKGDEGVGALPLDEIGTRSPGGLQLFVSGRDHDQPNVFDSETIEREVAQSAAMSGGDQPRDNRVPGTSETWNALYARANRGEAIGVPYHDVKVTDPEKLVRMTDAYQAHRRGELPREALPDLRDIFPDDPARLAEIGIGTTPGASGEDVLMQACSLCHNDRLDQSVSRARFRADLRGLSRAEKDRAIERLMLPANDVRAMPPARLRVLTPAARASAIAALRKE